MVSLMSRTLPSPPHQHPHRLGARLGRSAAPPPPLSQERPTYAEDRKAAEFHLRPSGALVQVLHGWNRCDLHTGHSWQHSDSEEAISRPVPFKSCPRAVRSQPNPPCRVPDIRYPFLATDLHLSLFPFFKKKKNCFHTCVPLYRHTSSHVKAANANRCAEDKKAEKNRSPKIGPAV